MAAQRIRAANSGGLPRCKSEGTLIDLGEGFAETTLCDVKGAWGSSPSSFQARPRPLGGLSGTNKAVTKVFPLPSTGSMQAAPPIILFFFLFLLHLLLLFCSCCVFLTQHNSCGLVGGELLLPWQESIPRKNSRWKLESAEGLENKHARRRLFLQV